jgi:hypothetical protein
MTAQTAARLGWLDEMTALYGPPRIRKPLLNARMETRSWLWPDASVTVLRWLSDDPQERSGHVTVCNGTREVELRDATCYPDDDTVREALRLARLLPCQTCRGLKEVPAGRDEAGEEWTRCGCTDPSPRPLTGVVAG